MGARDDFNRLVVIEVVNSVVEWHRRIVILGNKGKCILGEEKVIHSARNLMRAESRKVIGTRGKLALVIFKEVNNGRVYIVIKVAANNQREPGVQLMNLFKRWLEYRNMNRESVQWKAPGAYPFCAPAAL